MSASFNDRAADMAAPQSILLALGDSTVAYAFARILEMQGHIATVACSVPEAIESGPHDVVVLEASSHTCGIDALGAMRASGLDPKAILVSDEALVDVQPDVDVDHFLMKPVLPEQLLDAVESSRESGDFTDGSCGTEELSLDVVAHADAAERSAREVAAWCMRCDVAPSTRARIGSAVAEIVDNAAQYAGGTIRIQAEMSSTELRLDVSDDGPGFDAVAALTGDDFSSNSGLGRTHALADGVSIDSRYREGTTVTLQFRVTSVEFEDDHIIDLSDLDFFVPATSAELLATLDEDPSAPIVLSPALAVVVGRLLMGPRPAGVLEGALRA